MGFAGLVTDWMITRESGVRILGVEWGMNPLCGNK